MKRIVIVGILVLAGLLVFFFMNKKDKEEAPTNTTVEAKNELPNISIVKSDGSKQNLQDVTGNTALIFFQPDCDHCQREATEISNHLQSFSNYQLFFISTDDFSAMNKFAADYQLANKTNVIFAQTTVSEIMDNLGHISAPSLYIFRDKKLIKHLNGEKGIDEILTYI